MRKHLPYHLGLIIPCALIIANGLTTYFSVILFGSERSRKVFLVAYVAVWVSYGLAIFVKPGYTDGSQHHDGMYVECTKCHKPKPERAHHCRVCRRCVLQMDHHCPWTENCVGHNNMGHFMRFLVSAALLNAYGVYRTAAFLIYLFQHWRFRHRILPNNTRIWLASLGLVGDFFVMLTLSVLVLRVLMDCFQGQTQIENWERDRVRTLHRKRLAPKTEFPFDVGLVSNLETFFGGFPYDWLLPWGKAKGNGHSFPKLFPTTERWPPKDSAEVQGHEYYRADRWINFDGETLHDFGVDEGTADPDNIPLSEFRRRA